MNPNFDDLYLTDEEFAFVTGKLAPAASAQLQTRLAAHPDHLADLLNLKQANEAWQQSPERARIRSEWMARAAAPAADGSLTERLTGIVHALDRALQESTAALWEVFVADTDTIKAETRDDIRQRVGDLTITRKKLDDAYEFKAVLATPEAAALVDTHDLVLTLQSSQARFTAPFAWVFGDAVACVRVPDAEIAPALRAQLRASIESVS